MPSGAEDVPREIRVEPLPGHPLDELPENDRAEIAVDHPDAGQRVEQRRHRERASRLGARRLLVQRPPAGQSGRVRQQVTHGDTLLVRPAKLGEVALHGRVEIDLAGLGQLHHGRRHADDLGQRRHVPQRVLVRRRGRLPVERASAVLGEHAVAIADHRERAGERAVGPRAVEQRPGRCREASRRSRRSAARDGPAHPDQHAFACDDAGAPVAAQPSVITVARAAQLRWNGMSASKATGCERAIGVERRNAHFPGARGVPLPRHKVPIAHTSCKFVAVEVDSSHQRREESCELCWRACCWR